MALSPYKDNFKTTCKVAVIAALALADVERDPPQVDIYWSCPEEAEFDPTVRYVMIESKSGYFEATRHMLVAFQKSGSERYVATKQYCFHSIYGQALYDPHSC